MGRVFAVFLVTIVAAGGFFFLRNKNVTAIINSPIPKVNATIKEKSYPKNEWFPQKDNFVLGTSTLNLSAKSAILVDFDTKKIIYEKNPGQRLPIASTVKIMTALVALENADLSDEYVVSEKGAKVGENSMGLVAGEKLSLGDLLYGLMLVSGNDAAVAIAEGISGNEDAFVELMNRRTKDLGLGDTKFINSSGLDVDGQEQYSTAYDLAVISQYVWKNYSYFGEVSSTVQKYIESTGDHKDFDLYNDTNLLTTYPGVKGIKPGFTWEAGLCLVSYAENDGKRLLAVILGSDDRRGEMKELLDYGFNSFGIKVSHPALD